MPRKTRLSGFFMNNKFYMKRVISLAKKGRGLVSPNPLVGAVIVKNGRIISEDYHRRFGDYHAERNAILKSDSDSLIGSVLYVNLEPCSHIGKTPPCTDIIISSGIKKVVIGQIDPNPIVRGRGIEILRSNGIEVEVGVCEYECRRLNEVFNKFIVKKEPFVTLKIAQSLDGNIATKNGLSKWITSDISRRRVHLLRNEYDAVLVGAGTVISDNPKLTVRHVRGGSGTRIVLDSVLRIPLGSDIVLSALKHRSIIATTERAPRDKINMLKEKGCAVWEVPQDDTGRVDIPSVLKRAAKENIASILVEGGKEVFTAFLRSGKVDRMVVFTAPKVFGKGTESIGDLSVLSPDKAIEFEEFVWKKSGPDMMFDGRL